MDLGLKNKRVLVTGSTGGIGSGIAQKFAEEGATVVIHGRRSEAADHVAESIREAGGQAIIALGDLSVDEDVEKILAKIEVELGGVDILINNAAGGGHQNDMKSSAAEWMESYNINVLSVVRLIQKLLPAMQDQGWGRIINISSAAAMKPSPGMGVYSTTKSAINNLTVTLAQTKDFDKVTINTVSPGVIFTIGKARHLLSMVWPQIWMRPEALNKMVEDDSPFGRAGEVDEIANVVVFLSSPLASYIHGANIRVDGGYVPTVN